MLRPTSDSDGAGVRAMDGPCLSVMKRRAFLARAGLLAAGVGGAWWLREHVVWRRPDVSFVSGGTTGWLPYAEPRANLPTVMTTIAGIPVRALIDSGAQYSVIDRGLLDALKHEVTGAAAQALDARFKMPLLAYGVGGQPQLGEGTTLDIQVGGLTLGALRTAILQLGPLALREGLSVQLILGQDVLGETVLDLDTDDRRLALSRPGSHMSEAGVAPIEVRRDGDALAVETTVEGAVIEAVVDTGASALLTLSQSAAQSAGLFDGRPVREGSSIVLGGAMASQVIEARTLTFGDQLFRGVDLPIYPDVRVPGFPRALLGMEAFAGQRVMLDLGGGRLSMSRPLDLTVG